MVKKSAMVAGEVAGEVEVRSVRGEESGSRE